MSTHTGRIAGVAAGLFFGFIYLIAGFWDMLFFALLVWIGYWIGKQRDTREESSFSLQRFTAWLTDRWQWFK